MKPIIKISPLKTDQDWRRCRARIETFERTFESPPWGGWHYTYEIWKTLADRPVSWLIEFQKEGLLIGVLFLREHLSSRKWFPLRSLHSYDHIFFMRTLPFLSRLDDARQVAQQLAQSGREITKKTRADQLILRRIDPEAAQPLLAELRQKKIWVQKTAITQCCQLALDDDFDDYLKGEHHKEMKEIRRLKRRLAERQGSSPVTRHHRAEQLTNAEFEQCLTQFETLQALSWQHEWEDNSGRVDLSRVGPFNRAILHLWRARGMLDLFFLEMGDQLTAFLLTARWKGRVWLILMGYDPELRSFGIGKINFIDTLRSHHQLGFRLFEYGGEKIAWKTKWSNKTEESLHIEWVLPCWRGRIKTGLLATRNRLPFLKNKPASTDVGEPTTKIGHRGS